jgi:hypothetical protein
MGARIRKLIGSMAMIALVIVYALLAMALAQGRVPTAPAWAQMVIYAALGLAWLPPAMLIIRWMEKPSRR